jgi:hypothetical protein
MKIKLAGLSEVSGGLLFASAAAWDSASTFDGDPEESCTPLGPAGITSYSPVVASREDETIGKRGAGPYKKALRFHRTRSAFLNYIRWLVEKNDRGDALFRFL